VVPFVIAGTPAECADRLGELAERHGIDEFLLPVFEPQGAPALMAAVADLLART
jgi:alkanesulfonate monooxygenase SsuD/methylene tetrahydromethanopterin reductase-like flavin-dependent oxidoreductase (luciferase family)